MPMNGRRTKIVSLAHQVIDAIEGSAVWAFNLTEMHKPYMAPTKFVDVVSKRGKKVTGTETKRPSNGSFLPDGIAEREGRNPATGKK